MRNYPNVFLVTNQFRIPTSNVGEFCCCASLPVLNMVSFLNLAILMVVSGFLFVVFNLSFFFFALLGPHPRHMEVPRLGVELEL